MTTITRPPVAQTRASRDVSGATAIAGVASGAAGASGAATTASAPAPADQSAASTRFARISRRVSVVALLVCAALVVTGFATGTLTSVDRLRETLAGLGPLAPLAYMLLTATESVFPILPGGAGVIAAPVLFGPVAGVLYCYVAVVIGSVCAFLISRSLGPSLLYARFSRRLVDRYLGRLSHPHFPRYFALAIGLPVAPDDLLCYLAGLTTMRLRTFVLIILLLKPWSILAYALGVNTLLAAIFPGLGL